MVLLTYTQNINYAVCSEIIARERFQTITQAAGLLSRYIINIYQSKPFNKTNIMSTTSEKNRILLFYSECEKVVVYIPQG